jgi:hypothetical protein
MNKSKQITRIAAIPAVFVLCFAGAVAAHAGETVVSKVPFEFTMGDKTFPAGEYRFEVDQLFPDTVRVRSMDLLIVATALSHRAGGAACEGAPSVNFNVYGEQRFLSRIQTSSGTAVTLGQGSRERHLAKSQVASSGALVSASALRTARD